MDEVSHVLVNLLPSVWSVSNRTSLGNVYANSNIYVRHPNLSVMRKSAADYKDPLYYCRVTKLVLLIPG